MTQIFQISAIDLHAAITSAINEKIKDLAVVAQRPREVQRGGIELAVAITGKSKSWLYKNINRLPHQTFGRSLVFDRTELEAWVSDQMQRKAIVQEV